MVRRENHWNEELFHQIIKVHSTLSVYEGRSVFNDIHQTSDLFQELYQEIIPSKVRHSLGEFYTPL